MTNRYFLGMGVLGASCQLPIDKAQFKELKTSQSTLKNALFIEEKYEIIIRNYLEWERELMDISLSTMVSDPVDVYKEFSEMRVALNMRLVNLLISVHLYTNQVTKHITECLSDGDTKKVKDKVRKIFSEEEKNNEYCFMKELRNHVQHRDLAVHKVAIRFKRSSLKDDPFLEYSSSSIAQKNTLIQNESRSDTWVKNINGEEINLVDMCRIYIEAINRVHLKFREMINKIVESCRNILQKAIDEYESHCNKSIGLYAYEWCDKDNQEKDKVLVLLKWDENRKELIKRNASLVNLKDRHITGKTSQTAK